MRMQCCKAGAILALILIGSMAQATEPIINIENEILKGMLVGPGSEIHLAKVAPQRFADWKQMADCNSAAHQWLVGKCYENGASVPLDKVKAVRWYRKAAQAGYARAQSSLAYCLSLGQGAEKDEDEAIEWYEKAAAQGNGSALENMALRYELGTGVEKNEDKAYGMYRRAYEAYTREAEAGHAGSQFQLGRLNLEGGCGQKKNQEEGVRWYRRAAMQGHAWSQTNLGSFYWREGVYHDSRDAAEAKWLFQLAGAQGDTLADYDLARMYLEGTISGKDTDDAKILFKKVFVAYEKNARTDNSEAQYFLAQMYENGYGTSKNEAKALEWYRRAADLYYGRAQFAVGRFYHEGKGGVAKDSKSAAEWYRIASDSGHASASLKLAEMYDNGEGVSADPEKAELLREKAKKQSDS